MLKGYQAKGTRGRVISPVGGPERWGFVVESLSQLRAEKNRPSDLFGVAWNRGLPDDGPLKPFVPLFTGQGAAPSGGGRYSKNSTVPSQRKDRIECMISNKLHIHFLC
jgi:hypothetical protein